MSYYCDFSVISIYCYSCMHKYGFAVVLFLLLLLATVALYCYCYCIPMIKKVDTVLTYSGNPPSNTCPGVVTILIVIESNMKYHVHISMFSPQHDGTFRSQASPGVMGTILIIRVTSMHVPPPPPPPPPPPTHTHTHTLSHDISIHFSTGFACL